MNTKTTEFLMMSNKEKYTAGEKLVEAFYESAYIVADSKQVKSMQKEKVDREEALRFSTLSSAMNDENIGAFNEYMDSLDEIDQLLVYVYVFATIKIRVKELQKQGGLVKQKACTKKYLSIDTSYLNKMTLRSHLNANDLGIKMNYTSEKNLFYTFA